MSTRAVFLVTLATAAALYLPFLGALEYRGEEPRRLLPARTMLATGDWIVPRIGGAVYRKKPPLINWAIAASFRLTGVQREWSARLPSVLSLMTFAGVAAVALRRRFGPWGAATVGLFCLSTIAMLDKGRMAEIEAMYVAFTGIAFVLWAVWWTEGRTGWAFTVPWLFLGAGLLAKGPAHLLVFYLLVIPVLTLARRRRDLLSPFHFLGLALLAAGILAWSHAFLRQVGPEATTETASVWTEELAVRLRLSGVDWSAWAIRPLQIFGDFLPWTPLLVFVWVAAPLLPVAQAPEEDRRWDALIRGTRWGILAGLTIFLLLPQGSARYAQPLFPAACLVLVDGWSRLGVGARERWESRWRTVNRILGPIVLGGVGAAAIAVPLFLRTPWWPGLAVTGGTVALFLALRRGAARAALPPLVPSCLFLSAAAAAALAQVGPMMDRHGESRRHGRELEAAVPDDGRPVVFYRPGYFQVLPYFRRPYAEVESAADLPDGPVHLVLPTIQSESMAFRQHLDRHRVTELARATWDRREWMVLRLDPRPAP
jgi:4-amino-4-deoxy-L-arabinose transferase-like glycosyltransferase